MFYNNTLTFLTLTQVLTIIPLPESVWLKGVDDGIYPPAYHLGSGINGWRYDDIQKLTANFNCYEEPKKSYDTKAYWDYIAEHKDKQSYRKGVVSPSSNLEEDAYFFTQDYWLDQIEDGEVHYEEYSPRPNR